MGDPLVIAKAGDVELGLLPGLANRHGLISGATGTGKTVTLQTLAERFSAIGVPVFMADVKGDLSGMAAAGGGNARIAERAQQLDIALAHRAMPGRVLGCARARGSPVRATVSDLGPLLLARMLELNETQEGVLALVFKVADDAGLLLLDQKDLRRMLQHVGDRAAELTTPYGNVSAASIGAIQRGLLALEAQGGDQFFGEPMLNIDDLLQTEGGQGVVNILAAERLLAAPGSTQRSCSGCSRSCSTSCPRSVIPTSRGSCSSSTKRICCSRCADPAAREDRAGRTPDPFQGRGRVFRHAESPRHPRHRARSAREPRAACASRVHAARSKSGEGGGANDAREPGFDTEQAITELGVGEALVSLLDAQGRPTVTERALIVPPGSRIGPLDAAERARLIAASPLAGHYERAIDRESAYERLKERATGPRPETKAPPNRRSRAAWLPTSCSAGAARAAAGSRRG